MAADARNQLTGVRETQDRYPATDAVARPLPGTPSRAPSRASAGEDTVDGVPWRVEEHGTSSAVGARAAPPTTSATVPAPSQVPLPDNAGPLDTPQPLRSHGCWYPSVDPSGTHVAFICDRGGVPQLWSGPVGGHEVHLLDSDPHPVKEVAWSPDGRWIAYTTAPGGGEHTRVLCVRPDGTGRHILAGAEPGSSAYLGCWQHDGSAVAVTVAEPVPAPGEGEAEEWPALTEPGLADPRTYTARRPPGWAARDGRAVLLGGPHHGDAGPAHTVDAPAGEAGGAAHGPANPSGPGPSPGPSPGSDTASADAAGGGLAAYLVDPLGVAAPALLAVERGAATLRVCDISRDGRLALVRRGPRGRREALVVRTTDLRAVFALPVADGDPWIGRFSPDGGTLWLRSDASREFAALFAVRLGPGGKRLGLSVAAEREDCGLELLAFGHDGRTAALSWNVRGASELEVTAVTATDGEDARTGPRQTVALPHEVVTRIPRVGGDAGLVLALSGSQRRPGVWWFADGTARRTPWSSRDEDAVPPGRPPVRPVALRLAARDGLPLNGWYYRAPGRGSGVPAPCVLHLHGGPEEQERPVFNPLYHELLGRGVDVFAPDVRGSSGHGRSFVDADLGTGRFAAIEDVADCAAHVVLSGLADPRRLAVMGRSYGGYLVMACLVWHPDLFRTGVAACGMSDFATFYAGTEPWIAESAAHKYGHPEHDRALLRALSPMTRVDALRVPVLTVHGEHDTNVPLGESEQFVRAARERGLEAELLMLRDEGHDFLRADSRRLFRRTAADWIQRHIAE
ncbi:prolyl oligopeptidase family serine peptidase [Streptomyces scabiei]|nr:prolyl oligopeptidase family serine peptidase [Streptomyces scabiei]MDX2578862.1 prolyl oligopeptidase family serine peptidase [Streptomyces scabiei]MDX2654202.1 prolyl oligopeptidase family serine peptidase [Streptomyces scabiei]MDX2726077.1 prolyl oligopeptidase family serine peptidase [Streptomyces scabiei]MDX2884422.1 prolyl oligopeptidase family serine peptidase [Streptomyces scabiei]MDX2895429.1 prolyl oligopeptidase family serine peptidase [Streptomyces scabiei]